VLNDLTRLEANTLDFEVRAAVKAKNAFAINADFTIEDIAMRGIQGGTFTMGSSDSEAESDETPHTVTVGNFAMMKTEVTVAQFKVFIDETGYQTDADKHTGGYGSYCWNGSDLLDKKESVNWKCGVSGSLRPQSEYNHPVIHVSWNDAVTYAEWFSRKSGQTWRLPTVAEWEYAARGGQNYKYAGSDNLDNIAWYNGNSGDKTHPVGQKAPNGYGLYDMSGNVWEWCKERESNFQTITLANPNGSKGSDSTFRGGSWYYFAQDCLIVRSNNRQKDFRLYDLGFRLVSPK
jgi:formylglycine-generating enzyme required for sulfatase activity